MSVLESLIDFFAPHTCAGCGVEGELLCSTCQSGMSYAEPLCFVCKNLSLGFATCEECIEATSLTAVVVAAHYGGIAKELVWRLKFTGARAAAKAITRCMAQKHVVDTDTFIVPVPTATRRIRQRGYDQAALLAQNYAKQTGVSYLPCLHRYGQKQQRGSSRDERMIQLEGKYEVKNKRSVDGKKILLIDDVTTTGATLEEAARTLLSAGAVQVSALVFARA